MRKKNGFTLIELLAVIVILAIIALIATPTILGVIEKARKGSAESSALGYIDAVEKQVMVNEVDTSAKAIKDGSYSVKELADKGVSVKGKAPDNGTLTIKGGEVKKYSLGIGNYTVVNGKATKATTTAKKDNGYVIYLDPTDLNKKCTSSDVNSATGTKSGCMKWYVFNDKEEAATANLILDHNTTAKVAWNSSGSNASGMSEVAAKLESDTSSWAVPARLITAYEVADIVGKKEFKNSNSWFYLDKDANGNFGQTQVAKSKGASAYAWLYDRTRSDCESYGCANNESPSSDTYGYWTSTPHSVSTNAWSVYRLGNLSYNTVSSTGFGVRPVISVSKSIIY